MGSKQKPNPGNQFEMDKRNGPATDKLVTQQAPPRGLTESRKPKNPANEQQW